MSYTTKILKNGCKQTVYTGTNSDGLLGYKFTGTSASLEGIYRINKLNYYNIGITLRNFSRYASIKNVKLRVYTPQNASSMMVFARKTVDYSSNTGLSSATFNYINNQYLEADITKLIIDNLSQTYYLSVMSGSYLQIYNESAPTGYKPELIVEYVDSEQGLLNQKYVEGTVGDKERYRVNIRNGQPFVSKKLFELGGLAMPLTLSLEYNGLDTATTKFPGMPKGWKFNYQQKVYLNGNSYIYIDSVGTKHRFVKAENSTNIYFDIAGTGLILKLLDTGGFSIFDCYNNYLLFNQTGNLTEIQHLINDTTVSTEITYNSLSQIATIKDGMNRTISFEYSTSQITITGTGLQPVVIKLDSNGYLDEITELDTRKTTYSFDTSGMLLTTQTDNSEVVKFAYDGIKRISSVKKFVGEEEDEAILSMHTFSYKPLTTFVTNYQNVSCEYAFSEDGEIVSISEVNASSDGVLETIVKNDYETYKNVINKESFIGFSNINKTSSNNQAVNYNANYNSALSQGNLTFQTGEVYVLSFTYKITGVSPDGSFIAGSLNILQNDTLLNEFVLDTEVNYSKTACVLFKAINSTIPTITLNYKGANEVFNISKIRIYKYDPNIEKVCLNYSSGGDYSVVAASKIWYQIGDSFNDFVAGNTYTDKMYKEDLIENLKNNAIDEFSSYVWYNKKRGLVISNSTTLKIGSTQINLSAIQMALVSQNKNRTYVSFSDFSVSNCLKKDYLLCKTESEEFTSYKEVDTNFLVKNIRDPRGVIKTYSHNSLGHVTKEVVGFEGGSITVEKEYEYQNNYLVKEINYINGATSFISYSYDQNDGKLIKKTDSAGLVISYNHNTGDKLVKIATTISGLENANEFEYNKDLATKIKGNEPGISLTYDKYNYPNKFYIGSRQFLEKENDITTLGFTTVEKSEYDHNYYLKKELDKYGRLVKASESSDGTTYTDVNNIFYSDLLVDEIEDIDDPNSDDLMKLEGSKIRKIVDATNGNTSRFYYNNDGNISRISNSNSSHYPTNITLSYDAFERVVQKEAEMANEDIITTNIVYKDSFDDEIDNIETEYNFTYEETDDSLITTIYDSIKCKLLIDRDGLGRVQGKDYLYANSLLKDVWYEYLTNGTKTTNLISYEEHPSSEDEAYAYSYDNFGRIISVKDGSNNLLASYQYDLLGRLVRENNQQLNKTFVWTYDKNGNITSRQESTFTTGAVTTSPILYEYSSTNKDELVKYNNETVTTSKGAVITSIGDVQFQWNKRNKLKKISYSDGKYLTFEYNADGIRTTKVYYDGVNVYTHNYILDGNKIVQERITNGTTTDILHYLYINNEIVGFVYNQDKYYFQKNFRNDIIAIYNSSNNLVVKYVYDAWGNHTVYDATGAENNSATFIGNINPFRYRGYYYDTESELYYCIARYYNPEIGRWMCLDDLEYLNSNKINGLNIFVYCDNNPVCKVDSTGNDAIYVTMYLLKDGGIWVVGHARLYYQDENGEWWYTEYGGKFPWTAHIRNNKTGKTTEQLMEELEGKMYDVVFLKGDYSYIKDYAEDYKNKPYKQGYRLIRNNCLKYVVDALNSGGENLPYLVVPMYFSQFLKTLEFMTEIPEKLSGKSGGGISDAGFGYVYDRNDPLYNLLSRYGI